MPLRTSVSEYTGATRKSLPDKNSYLALSLAATGSSGYSRYSGRTCPTPVVAACRL
nr:hypothetical protein [Nakamurella aerolata]